MTESVSRVREKASAFSSGPRNDQSTRPKGISGDERRLHRKDDDGHGAGGRAGAAGKDIQHDQRHEREKKHDGGHRAPPNSAMAVSTTAAAPARDHRTYRLTFPLCTVRTIQDTPRAIFTARLS